MRKNSRSVKRKSISKGWKKASPKHGSQRRNLFKKCGSKCFLQPRELKYPICSPYSRKLSCAPDSRGVLSAYRRARQYHHNDIANRALRVAKKHKFSWLH